MAEFDYKQRPFKKQLTDEEYDRAVGRTPSKTMMLALCAVCPVCSHDNCAEEHCGGPWHRAEYPTA